MNTYPNSPGYKAPGPSQESAQSIAPSALTLRERVLAYITRHGPKTADECAEAFGATPFAVRPRLTELLRMGKIEDSGERRRNSSGHKATVWRVATKKQAEFPFTATGNSVKNATVKTEDQR